LADLAPQTIRDNARFFKSAKQVPRLSITMGVGTILEARKIVLIASGAKKAAAISNAIQGPIDSACTASALQKHPDVTFLLDAEAASLLLRAGNAFSGSKNKQAPQLVKKVTKTKKVICKAAKKVISKAKPAAKK
jgi:hypothetical protein